MTDVPTTETAKALAQLLASAQGTIQQEGNQGQQQQSETGAAAIPTGGPGMTTLTMNKAVATHPLFPVFIDAINQALYGKGTRHGGATTPFIEQPIFHYPKMHGRGFLTGQAAKKLEEAASNLNGEQFIHESLGALVYVAAAILYEDSPVGVYKLKETTQNGQ